MLVWGRMAAEILLDEAICLQERAEPPHRRQFGTAQGRMRQRYEKGVSEGEIVYNGGVGKWEVV